MIARRAWRMVAALVLATATGVAAGRDQAREADWRKVATTDDRARLRRWRAAWMEALAAARARDAGTTVAADPALFDPDRAVSDAMLPAGRYRCRTTRLGMAGAARASAGWTTCSVAREDGATGFEIQGTPRIRGRLYADGNARLVFLGTLGLGDERRMIGYGRDTSRDTAGLVERIGARRWRLVLPYPHFGGALDLVEIVPGG